MEVLVLNAQRAKGTSQKNGAQYDICTISYCVPVSPVQKETRQVIGYGFNAQEIGLDPSKLGEFAKLDFPAKVNLIIEPDPANLNRNLCKGIAG